MAATQLTVWYNTLCPVCHTGIDWQRAQLIEAVKAGRIEFRDINAEPEALASFGVTVDDVRRRLHAVDGKGRLIVGVDVAIALWRTTPSLSWLAALTGNRLMRPLTRFAYDRFADRLFAWNRRKGHW